MRNRITSWLQAEPVPDDLRARVMADPRLSAQPGAAFRGRLAFATAALVVLVVGAGLASILLRGAHPAGVVGQVPASPSATPSSLAPAPSPAPASPAAASPAPTPSVAPAQTSPALLPKCRTTDLAVVIGSTTGAAGTIYSNFNVTNRTSAACSLQGFFGLALLDAAGQQVGGTPRRDPSAISPTLVRLAPGGSTAFTFHWSDVQSSPQPCPTAAQVVVTAPDQFDHVVLPARTADGGRIAPCEPGGTG
ncbi:MAG TPA: DUF4232 domain-containing protein, partial [Candidatus Dormibacteraeota bacterium]|nr:DUF4232 domain-containing protein [Candidatus Dormibacteraeota bacterium]